MVNFPGTSTESSVASLPYLPVLSASDFGSNADIQKNINIQCNGITTVIINIKKHNFTMQHFQSAVSTLEKNRDFVKSQNSKEPDIAEFAALIEKMTEQFSVALNNIKNNKCGKISFCWDEKIVTRRNYLLYTSESINHITHSDSAMFIKAGNSFYNTSKGL